MGRDLLTVIQAVICFSFIPTTYFFYPETANRTLEDIDRFFEKSPPIFVHRNKIAVQLKRPAEYIEDDERIAQHDMDFKEKEDGSIGVQHVEATKEV